MSKSLTLRLALFFGVLSTASLIAIGYLASAAVERHFLELDRTELESKRDFVRRMLATHPVDGDREVTHRLEEVLAGQQDLLVQVTGSDGKRIYVTPGATFSPMWRDQEKDLANAAQGRIATWEASGHLYRGMRSKATAGASGSPATVLVAINIDRHHEFKRSFYETLWTAVGLAILVTGLLGWLAARRGLEPVRSMARVAQNITASHLGERLALDTLPVELTDLAQAFNAMLSRLEESFRRLSEFSSDLAHELRTPIGNLITHTQVALARSRSADEYRDVLYSNVEEFERLARMISDMLFLAKADNGLIVPRSEAVDLATEVRDLFDYYDALVEERGLRVSASGSGTVRGERLMIRRAISNLLSNAVNHSQPGGGINVSIDKTVAGKVRLSVENTGETIAPEHLERIFDRFYRVDPARQRLSEGAGLGLAITKSIVAAHGGAVAAFSAGGTTRIEILFPPMASS